MDMVMKMIKMAVKDIFYSMIPKDIFYSMIPFVYSIVYDKTVGNDPYVRYDYLEKILSFHKIVEPTRGNYVIKGYSNLALSICDELGGESATPLAVAKTYDLTQKFSPIERYDILFQVFEELDSRDYRDEIERRIIDGDISEDEHIAGPGVLEITSFNENDIDSILERRAEAGKPIIRTGRFLLFTEK